MIAAWAVLALLWDRLAEPYGFWLKSAVFGSQFIYFWRRVSEQERWTYRWQNGLCVTCGYDLRATPDRCPECGTVPGRTAPKSR